MFSSICNPHVHGAHPGERFPWDGEDPCLCCTKSHRCTLRASVLGGGFSSSRGGDGAAIPVWAKSGAGDVPGAGGEAATLIIKDLQMRN